jgi:hypothetical protein
MPLSQQRQGWRNSVLDLIARLLHHGIDDGAILHVCLSWRFPTMTYMDAIPQKSNMMRKHPRHSAIRLENLAFGNGALVSQ